MLVKILLGLLMSYISFNVSLYLLQDLLIFQPESLSKTYQYGFQDTFEEVWLQTEDNLQINALHFKAEQPRGVVLYFHGNKGNLLRWGFYYRDFTRYNYDFLAIDYRGFGKSEGEASEAGSYKDARAAYKWLLERYDASDIIIYGRSLGSGVACQLATEVSSKMVVLETPFNSIQGAFEHSMPFFWYPYPFRTVYSNETKLPNISDPVYIFQGTADRTVPYSSVILLEPLLKPGDAFYTIEKGGHRNLNSFPAYYQYLEQILVPQE